MLQMYIYMTLKRYKTKKIRFLRIISISVQYIFNSEFANQRTFLEISTYVAPKNVKAVL